MNRHEIEQAITKLSPEELARFRRWFEKFYAKAADKQYEHDIIAGSNASQSDLGQHVDKLKGSLKGKGLIKALMADKKLEKEL